MTGGSSFRISTVLSSKCGSCFHFFYHLVFFSDRCLLVIFQRSNLFHFSRLLLMHLQLPFPKPYFVRIGRILLKWRFRPKRGVCWKIFSFAIRCLKFSNWMSRFIQNASQDIFVVIRSGNHCLSFRIPIRICKTRTYSPSAVIIPVLFQFL